MDLSAIANALHHFGHENSSIALACVLRVRADRAHFGVPRNFQPFTRHSDKLSLRANAQVGAQFVGTTAERPRLGHGRQFDHLGGIARAEFE
jgi:hypothetical protein